MTTTKNKIKWLSKATSEELMNRYDLAYYQCTKSSTDNEWEEWLELAREEILNRISR